MNKTFKGRYEIGDIIGAGGMAIVYKAKDTLLNRTVAIKVLREQYVSDEGFIRRFRREAQSAASLSHPNIVSIYDVGKDGNEEYIVMEYVKGQTLKEIIREEAPFPAEKAIYIVRQIAEALAHAHANHIIHRDIKPQNILVTNDGRIKVTDFGIARAASAATLTNTGDIVGSVHYLSPEQAKGAQTNEQSDIYSLGIILYELLTGKVPFDGDTPISVALKHIQEQPELPSKIVPSIPAELDAVVMKALAKSLEDRYQSATELLSDLERVLTGQTVIWDKTLLANEDAQKTEIHKGLGKAIANDRNKLNSRNKLLEDTIHRKKKKKRQLIAVLAAVIVLVISGTVYGLYKFLYVPEVAVPDLRNLTLEQAEIKLRENGLELGEVTFDYHDEIEKGKIISQSYAPDTMVKMGRPIDVTVSQGVEFLTFPNLIGENLDKENAVNVIRAAGFEGDITFESRLHPTVEENRVIDQDPAPYASWAKNAPIKLYISSGPELKMEVMPDVTTLSSKEAKEILEAYKLIVIAQTESSNLYPPDVVIATVPAAGKPVKQGSEVVMIISDGPGPPP